MEGMVASCLLWFRSLGFRRSAENVAGEREGVVLCGRLVVAPPAALAQTPASAAHESEERGGERAHTRARRERGGG
eukprot:689665-Rhodomonas_salina.2